MKKDKKMTLLIAILFFLLGIILFQNPNGVIQFITYIFGGLFLLIGIIYLIQYGKKEEKNNLSLELYSGIVSIIIGLLVIFCAGAIEFAIRFITGIWILYRALIHLRYSFLLKDLKDTSFVVHLCLSILLILMAFYTILKSHIILSTIGLIFILYGTIEFISVILEIIPKKKKDIVIK